MDINPFIWARMVLLGYLLTISLEMPVLLVGLGQRYSVKERLLAGILLTTCSYPFITILFPLIWNPYRQYRTYITVSEIFAPLCECLVFAFFFQRRKCLSLKQRSLDFVVIILANLLSFLWGEWLKWLGLGLH